jgi:hypothetical protein
MVPSFQNSNTRKEKKKAEPLHILKPQKGRGREGGIKETEGVSGPKIGFFCILNSLLSTLE